MTFNIHGVNDGNGKPYTYKVTKNDGNIIIRVGKEDVYISGIHTYVISYTVSGAIRYFNNHDELYWNVTGNGWDVFIDKASSTVILPQSEFLEMICFTGSINSTISDCTLYPDRNQFTVEANKRLYPSQGLTFAASFPKGIVSVLEPKRVVNFWDTLIGKIVSALIALFIFLYYILSPFVVFFMWYRYGRDPKVSKPVSAWFDPPKDKQGRKLTPAEVGTLVDESADSKDVSATIIDLAIRGYLTIKEIKKGKEYEFKKANDFNKIELTTFEKTLLSGLFKEKDNILTKDLKSSFYKTSEKAKNEMYEDLVNKSFFPTNPGKQRSKYYLFSALSLITGNLFLGLALAVFGKVMPRKTIFGAISQSTAFGLRNFLKSQERQIEFQGEKSLLFEKLLPYAIVFGVEKEWAKRFEDIHLKPPIWYESSDTAGSFNSLVLANNLTKATDSIYSISSPPSSSRSSGFSSGFSGGSSGGGFGGGGGSSW